MSSSKLSALCDKIIESCWLAAVIVAPLFFSGYSSTVMDSDKLALLRSLASIMIAAWLIRWIEQRKAARVPTTISLRAPFVLPTLILVVVYLLATFTSIAPRVALFGSYHRAEGLLAFLSYVVIFAMLAQGLRSRAQLDRLIFTIVLTSFPIALYGIIQKFDLDPLKWSEGFDGRVGSTLGNPIFLSAYLIMVFPLTLAKIVGEVRAFSVSKKTSTAVGTAVYICVAAVQCIAMVLADSRGPWLGWFAAVVLFALLMALVLRQRWLVLGAVGLGVAGVVFLGVLNLPNSPLAKLREIPVFARLGNLSNPTGDFRLFTWENATRLVFPHDPIQFPDGTPDRLNVIRSLLGYGLDAMPLVYPQVSSPSPFSRIAGTDRSHNETLDELVTTGVFGLIAYQLLWLSVFVYGLRWLGLMLSRQKRNLFISLWIGLGLAGGLVPVLFGQARFIGLGIAAGNIIAVLLYLVIIAIRPKVEQQTHPVSRADQILLVALLAGLFANYVESQFGIAVPATRTLWWTFAGMLVVVGAGYLHAEPWLTSRSKAENRAPALVVNGLGVGSANVASYAAVVTIILATLLYEFVGYDKNLADPIAILWRAFSFDPVHNVASFAILALFLATWVIGLILILSGANRAGVGGRGRVVLAAGVSLVPAILFGLGLAVQLAALKYIPTSVGHLEDVFTLVGQTVAITDYYSIGLMVLIMLAAVALLSESKSLPVAWMTNKLMLIAIIPIVLGTWLWVSAFNLNPVRADVVQRMGKLFDDQSEWEAAIALYQRAIQLAPTADSYYMALGRAYQSKARSATLTSAARFGGNTQIQDILNLDAAQAATLNRVDLLYAAQQMLLRARDLNPLYSDHTLNLARFYVPDLPVNTPSKEKLADLSEQYYSQVLRLSPNSVVLWNEWADFELVTRNNPDAALQKLKASLAQDPKFEQTYLYLGNAYALNKNYDQAIPAYQKALALQPALAEAASKLAFVYYKQGKVPESIRAYLKYVEISPNTPNSWEAHKNLALLYEQSGDLPLALGEAQRATALAPTNLRDQTAELVSRLRARLGTQ